MAQFTVRDLEDDVKARLKRRASRNGVSMEEEVRRILRNAVRAEERPVDGLGSRIAARFAKTARQGAKLAGDLPEQRGQPARPASFDK